MHNIKILDAEWCMMCGNIVFQLNFAPYTQYKLRVGGNGLLLSVFENDIEGQPKNVSIEEILDIIRQGDVQMWTFAKFITVWQTWAACLESIKKR